MAISYGIVSPKLFAGGKAASSTPLGCLTFSYNLALSQDGQEHNWKRRLYKTGSLSK